MLGSVGTGAFVLSHVLAPQIGAWPSVLAVATATGLAAALLSDRRPAAAGGDRVAADGPLQHSRSSARGRAP